MDPKSTQVGGQLEFFWTTRSHIRLLAAWGAGWGWLQFKLMANSSFQELRGVAPTQVGGQLEFGVKNDLNICVNNT